MVHPVNIIHFGIKKHEIKEANKKPRPANGIRVRLRGANSPGIIKKGSKLKHPLIPRDP